MAILFTEPRFRPLSSTGGVYAGAKLYSYQTGTTTLQNTYSDSALTAPNANPVVALGDGLFGPIYLDDSLPKYKFALKDSADNTIWTIDPYNPDQEAISGSLIHYDQTAAELAAGVTPTNYAYAPGNARRYGAVADGAFSSGIGTDNSAAIQRAITVAAQFASLGGGAVFIPAGVYKLVSAIQIPEGVTVYGEGKWSTILFCPTAFTNTSGLVQLNGSSGPPTGLRSLGVLSATGGCTGYGVVVTSNGSFLADIWVNGFTLGVSLLRTDTFIEDFCVEICTTGIFTDQVNVNIAHGTVHSCANGITVTNSTSVEYQRVIVSGVRATACTQNGFVVSAGKLVTFIGCVAAHQDGSSAFSTAGFNISSSSSDVILSGCAAELNTATASAGVLISSSTDVQVTGGKFRGFFDGLRILSSTRVTVSSNDCSLNARRGIYASAGDQISITGNVCYQNGGAGSTDAGVYSDNTASFSHHLISGNTCVQTGGGVQEYGIYSSITDNGGNSGYTLIANNVTRFNGTADISFNGYTQNILANKNLPTYAPTVASATTVTLPGYSEVIFVSGTTTITSVTAAQAGREVTLIFQGALTFTDGSNLKLNGNFVTTADDAIKLVSDGANWFEVSRSVN